MGLIAHWRLDDLRDSVGDNHLISYLTGLSLADSKFNKGYKRDSIGTSGHLKSTRDIILDKSFTMSCWAFITEASATANGLVSNHSHSSNTGSGLTVAYVSASDYRLSCNTGDGTSRTYNSYRGTTNIKDKWCHLAMTYDRDQRIAKLWVNGVMETSFAYNLVMSDLPIGIHLWTHNSTASTYLVGGIIDDVKIFDHALSDLEMREESLGEVVSIDGKVDHLNNSDQEVSQFSFGEFPIVEYNGFSGVKFDGIRKQITLSTNSLDISKFSISMWFRIDALQDWNTRFDLLTGSGSGEGRLLFYRVSATTLRFHYAVAAAVTIDLSITKAQALDWNHVVFTFDDVVKQIKCYVNGVLFSTKATTGSVVYKNTSVSLASDRGNSNYANCSISEFKWFSEVVDISDVKRLYNTKASLDNIGNLHSNILENSYVSGLLRWDLWKEGQTGNSSGFSQNGSTVENSRVKGLDPWGKEIVLWQAIPDDVSGPDGGWNTSYYPIDPSYLYRFSVWVKLYKSHGSSHFGLNAGGVTVMNRSNLASTTNPYFNSTQAGISDGGWYLLIGHVFPHDAGAGASHPESGYYALGGAHIRTSSTDFIFSPGSTTARHRAYLYYCTDITQRQWWCYPRIDKIDGNEPSINQLLNGYDSLVYDAVVSKTIDGISPFSVGMDNSSAKSFNETKTIDGVYYYLPLIENMKEMINRNDATGTATYTPDGFSVANNTIIKLPIISFANSAEWTINIIYKRDDTIGNSSWRTIIGTDSNIHPLIVDANKVLGIYDGTFKSLGFTPLDNITYTLCVKYTNGSKVELYVDGVVKGTVTTTLNNVSLPWTSIGNWGSLTYGCGVIKEFQIYDRHLSLLEIKTLHDLETNPDRVKMGETTYIRSLME